MINMKKVVMKVDERGVKMGSFLVKIGESGRLLSKGERDGGCGGAFECEIMGERLVGVVLV